MIQEMKYKNVKSTYLSEYLPMALKFNLTNKSIKFQTVYVVLKGITVLVINKTI